MVYRIDDATAAATLPTIEAAGTGGYFTEGNAGAGTPATLVRASWLNMVQEEMVAAISAGGLSPNKSNRAQLATAMQKQGGNYAADTGTANAMSVTLSPAPASYGALFGAPIRLFKSAAANTGAVTLNVNGLGAQSVVWRDGTALVAGDLPASCGIEIMCAGSYFVLAGPVLRPAPMAYFTSSLGATGWKRVADTSSPTGYIIEQWGVVNAPANAITTFNFGLTFPNAAMSIVGTQAAGPLGAANYLGFSVLSAGQFNVTNGDPSSLHGGSYMAKGY